MPFTKRIARSWSDAFASNLLGTLEERAAAQIELLLGRVVASVPAYLQPRAQEVVRSIMRSARRELHNVRALVRTALDKLKTDLSQSLSPLVQSQLAKGYEDADAYSPRLPPAAVRAPRSSSDRPDADSLAGTAPRAAPSLPEAPIVAHAPPLTRHPRVEQGEPR